MKIPSIPRALKKVLTNSELEKKIDTLSNEKTKLLQENSVLEVKKKHLKERLKETKEEKEKLLQLNDKLSDEKDELKKNLEDSLKTEIKKDLPEDEIIYLTGMSINKKTFHTVYKNMKKDDDYHYFIRNIIKYILETKLPLDFSFKSNRLNISHSNNDTKAIGGMSAQKTVNELGITSDKADNITEFLSHELLNNIPAGYLVTKGLTEWYLKSFNKNLKNISLFAQNIVLDIVKSRKTDSVKNFINQLEVNDFFAIYQSNQSDSRGLVPLANNTTSDFALNYGYSDLPFYENLFVNDVFIELLSDRFTKAKNLKSCVDIAFKAHGLDIFLSRIMAFCIENSIKDKEIQISKAESFSHDGSFKRLMQQTTVADANQFSGAFKERNLFGIDLLSRVLSVFISLLNNKEEDTIKVYIDKSKKYSEHLIELLEYSSCPTSFKVVSDKRIADFQLSMSYLKGNDIYRDDYEFKSKNFSNDDIVSGFWQKKKGCLGVRVPVKIFVSIPQNMEVQNNRNQSELRVLDSNHFSKFYSGMPVNNETIDKESGVVCIPLNSIKNGSLRTDAKKKQNNNFMEVYPSSDQKTVEISYKDNSDNEFHINIDRTKEGEWKFRKKAAYNLTKQNFNYKTIEVDKERKQAKVLVPYRLMHDTKDKGDMNIITVGGAEHNRPLMRLLNAHRMQQGKNRNLGFFDNIFDYIHREENEEKRKHYFLAGVNQPVSGFNALLSQRENDIEGNSVSTSAKLLYFKIDGLTKENTLKTFHVLSVYGFSALASAFATLYAVYKITEQKEQKEQKCSLVAKAVYSDEFVGDSVYTRRLIFKPNEYMESRFHEICNGLEYLSFVRVDKYNELFEFITTQQTAADSASIDSPVIDDQKAGLWMVDTGKSSSIHK